MKRLVLTLVAGAFGSLMMLPIAHAQSQQDMNNDAGAIQQDHNAVQQDQQERSQDVKSGRYGAAAREQSEIDQRHADMADRKGDLNSDLASHDRDRDGDRDRHSDDDNQ